MTKQTLLFITVWTSCTICFAQQPGPGRVLTFDAILKRQDANQDGKISKAEFRGPPRLFQRLDTNGDGMFTREEFTRRRNQPQQGRGGAGQAADDVRVLKDVVFGKGGDRDLKMHIVLPKVQPESPAPVFVWVHGGGWMGGTKEGGVRQVLPFVRQGFVGATIEYRLTGEAPFPAQIEDCKCAIRYLRAHAKKYNIDPKRIAVGGSSAGGHLVALLGTSGGVKELEGNGGWADQSSSVQAVIDLYGPTDFKLFVTTKGYERHNQDGSPESRLLGGGEVASQTEKISRVNPITYIDESDPPFLIVHGTSDGTVPANQSEALHAALKKAKVSTKLHLIDGAGHGGPEFAAPTVNRMKEDFLFGVFHHKKTREAQSAQPRNNRQGAATNANVPRGVKLEADIAYREGNDAWKLDLLLPDAATGEVKKKRPAIVFVHGGGWRSGDKRRGYFFDGAKQYAQQGYVCATVNYRLTGEAPFPACIEDVKCAVRWLRAHADKYNIDPDRIGAYGNSAGAHLVSMLGLTSEAEKLEGDGPWQKYSSSVQAVCASATPTDFMNWGSRNGRFRGESTLLSGPEKTLEERKKLASPITHVSRTAPPFLLIHGTADRTVPYSQGTSFAKALKAAGANDVTLLSFEGAGHGVFLQKFRETDKAMKAFFTRTLNSQKDASGASSE